MMSRLFSEFRTDTALIVDADVHLHENPNDMAPFAAGLQRKALEVPDSERWLDTPELSPLTAYDVPIADDPDRAVHVVRNANQLRSDLDNLGIDAAIVFPGRMLGTASSPQSSIELTEVYNRYVNELWVRPADGIYGALMVASQDPKASAAQIERYAAADGFAAVYLPTAGVHPLWGHRQYDPIYAAAQAARLPVVAHGLTHIYPVFPFNLERFDTAIAKQTLAKPLAAIANLVDMVTTGVFARFPDLKVVFPETGLSWLPFVMWRLDQQYKWLAAELPFYTDKPSTYIKRQVFVTTHSLEEPDDPAAIAALLDAIGGPERALYASDWPHYDHDRPERVSALAIPDAAKRRILGYNARDVFRIAEPRARPAGANVAATR